MKHPETIMKKSPKKDLNENRARLIDSIPVRDRRYKLGGLSTAVLEGGEGKPVILLHGPGESSLWWMRVLPDLVKKYSVIVPDLPGHGATDRKTRKMDEKFVSGWLTELIETACQNSPVLVGHILGGSIAARYAVHHPDRLRKLILVNSLGLARFRPSPLFAFGLIRFMVRSTRKNYTRFLQHCMLDTAGLRAGLGRNWNPFLQYVLDCANDPDRKAALRDLMKQVGIPPVPADDLAGIRVPVELIWGRHDLANKLEIAEIASKRYGWPLHIVDEARDDPKLEQPHAFLQCLYKALQDLS